MATCAAVHYAMKCVAILIWVTEFAHCLCAMSHGGESTIDLYVFPLDSISWLFLYVRCVFVRSWKRDIIILTAKAER